MMFVGPFAGGMIPGGILLHQGVVRLGVVGGIRGIEDAGGTPRVIFIGQFLLEGGFHKTVAAFHDLLEERRADRIDKVGGKDPAHK